MNVQARGSSSWGVFDSWADRLVRREVSFDIFAINVKSEVSRMAWAATRRRRPPCWMGIEDIEALILQRIWYYAFQHRTREGKIGFDPSRSSSAGAYLRWNSAQHVQKDIGKARGENMHAHRLIGPPPESVTKTGETPELEERVDEEERFDDGRRAGALARITQATKNFILENEVVKVHSTKERARVVAFLMTQPPEVRSILGIRSRQDAGRFWSMFVSSGLVKEALTERDAVASSSVVRHPMKDAFPCEDSLLVEEPKGCSPTSATLCLLESDAPDKRGKEVELS